MIYLENREKERIGVLKEHLENIEKNKIKIGDKFGKMTVIEHAGNAHRFSYLCKCECGFQRPVSMFRLTIENPPKCGSCSRKNYDGPPRSQSNTYSIWNGMRDRCNNKNNPSYRNYGGRGITVCKRWNIYDNFLNDMGERPAGLQIDRIDPDGDYEPGNCRWVTPAINCANRRISPQHRDNYITIRKDKLCGNCRYGKNPNIGSSFESWLKEESIYDDIIAEENARAHHIREVRDYIYSTIYTTEESLKKMRLLLENLTSKKSIYKNLDEWLEKDNENKKF